MGDHGRRPNAEVIISEYEDALGSMVGCLSRFIVRKQYERIVNRKQVLDRNGAMALTDLVVDEAAALIGRSKAEELKRRLSKVNDSYFGKEGSG